jgi:DNA invertase Pin-like site-specific DNA recombinase
VCSADTKKRAKATAKKAAVKAAKPKKSPVKRAKPSSDTEKAAYMREYRRRKEAGEKIGDYRRVTPEEIETMVDLRLQGLTYRAIGTEVGKDFSYVARVVKKALAERRAEESNPMP